MIQKNMHFVNIEYAFEIHSICPILDLFSFTPFLIQNAQYKIDLLLYKIYISNNYQKCTKQNLYTNYYIG